MGTLSHKRIFYSFLIFMAFLHGVFLITKMKDHTVSINLNPHERIKVRVINPQDSLVKRQIVQSEDSASDKVNEKEAFLSDKNRHFDRERVSQNTDKFNKAAKGNSHQDQERIKNMKLSDISVAGDFPKFEAKSLNSHKKGMENGDESSFGLSATNDYVQEMELGDFTQLNTVEYKYYGFYHRIRQKLEQFWGNSIQEKSIALFKSGRRMPASQDFITSLRVTLNARGEITMVKILGASGVKELDDAAIESFNQAGPFPNPPKDLLVNGEATIEWGFVVKS